MNLQGCHLYLATPNQVRPTYTSVWVLITTLMPRDHGDGYLKRVGYADATASEMLEKDEFTVNLGQDEVRLRRLYVAVGRRCTLSPPRSSNIKEVGDDRQ